MSRVTLFAPVVAVVLVASACLGPGDDAVLEPTDEGTPAADPAAEGTPAGDESGDADAVEAAATDDVDGAEAGGGPAGDDAADVDDLAFDDAASPLVVPDDVPCDGGAFPGDDEFRELLCAVNWAQVQVMRNGGEMDVSWVERIPAAISVYADDRPGAVAQLEVVLAEMLDAAGASPVPTADADVTVDDIIEAGEATGGLQSCMVEVAELIIEANVTAGFDPTAVDEWKADVDEVDALVDAGDLAGAEAAVCALRDEIAAAIADPSLVP